MAGVSPSTVSRVMNGTANVDDEKKQRVLKVIEETGFRPNETARTLYKNQQKNHRCHTPEHPESIFNEMARAIEEESYRRGTGSCSAILIMTSKKKNEYGSAEQNECGRYHIADESGGHQESVEQCRVPVVVLDREVRRQRTRSHMSSRIITRADGSPVEHLVKCGCRHIVNMRGDQAPSSARKRFEGYLAMCSRYDVAPRFVDCKYSFQEGIRMTEELLEISGVDGIIAGNDMVAVSVTRF